MHPYVDHNWDINDFLDWTPEMIAFQILTYTQKYLVIWVHIQNENMLDVWNLV